MKRRIGTIIEEEVIRRAKRRAIEENRSLSDLIQDALVSYLGRKAPAAREREAAYGLFCEQPMRITREQLSEIVNEDALDL
jgi:uncharacterized protein DUF6364